MTCEYKTKVLCMETNSPVTKLLAAKLQRHCFVYVYNTGDWDIIWKYRYTYTCTILRENPFSDMGALDVDSLAYKCQMKWSALCVSLYTTRDL